MHLHLSDLLPTILVLGFALQIVGGTYLLAGSRSSGISSMPLVQALLAVLEVSLFSATLALAGAAMRNVVLITSVSALSSVIGLCARKMVEGRSPHVHNVRAVGRWPLLVGEIFAVLAIVISATQGKLIITS
jgi:hypothetical protein